MTGSERQEKKTWMVSLISMILILGFFAISCLFLMNVGVQVYRRIVTANNDNFQLRTSLSYTATKGRQADKNGGATGRRVGGERPGAASPWAPPAAGAGRP